MTLYTWWNSTVGVTSAIVRTHGMNSVGVTSDIVRTHGMNSGRCHIKHSPDTWYEQWSVSHQT